MNKIYLYNTLTRRKEEFKPLKKGEVKIYHCGPTVYWTQHIGNLRGMTMADIIVRTFRYLGYGVKYVRNYTDVGHLTSDEDEGEDKMEKGARREGKSPKEISKKYIKIFERDTKALNLCEPNYKPIATNHVNEMIEMTKVLLDKGFAYCTDLAIYFDTKKTKNYTALSRQDIEANISGTGKGKVADKAKKQASDFALWFFRAGIHKNALQYWPSPFKSPLARNGEGFPGWHIECSAMSKKYLGSSLDIHLGGIEHVPVHHTNEIAQSEAANDVKFVNYWLHNEHLLVNDRKMAKSEGTGYSLEEIKSKGFSPMALRFFFLGAHYRSKQNFTWQAMKAAQNGLDHLYNQVRELGDKRGKICEKYQSNFMSTLGEDFNTPRALAIVQELLKSDISGQDKLSTILDFDKVLGLDLDRAGEAPTLPEEVRELLKERDQARESKDFDKADKIRGKIDNLGYIIEDVSDGIRVCKK